MVDFVLGRLKFVYRGAWAASTAYVKDDIVRYGGRSYVCKTNHTSGVAAGGFETALTATYWELMNDGIEYKGNWAATTYYKVNDIVKWGADIYICTTSHTAGASWVSTEANFALLVGGLEFENTWANTTLYQPGDVVRYGGYQFVATNESTNTLPTNTSYWSVLSTGYTTQGVYSNTTAYKPGDVVTWGGYTYVAKVDTTGYTPANSSNWDITVYGQKWNGAWANTTRYQLGDVAQYGGTSYVSVVYENLNNTPDPSNTNFWNIVSQGANTFAQLTSNGDMLYLAPSGIDNLSIGTNGQILTVNTTGYPAWDYNGKAQNVYYVSVDGVDAADAGTTMQRPFRTINYATQQVSNNSVILVRAGTYTETLPITVPSGVSIIGDSQRTVKVQPAGGYTGAGNTMWLLSDATLLKQMTFIGMTGFVPGGTDNDITTATIGGVFVRLNPASPILTKSPYVLECSAISTGGVGAIIDGSVHASGNKSMVFHAYTNINDGGVGYWISNDGRAEIVSCFTYFCYFGLATSGGGFIRGLNNNNSYGKYGAVSRGFLSSEVTANGEIYGEQLQFSTGSTMAFTIGETITGGTSGATGVVRNVQTAANKIYYNQTSVASFANSEIVTGGTSGTTATITSSGVTGQKGFVLVVTGFTSDPNNFVGRSIEFTSGDTGAYVIQSVSGTYTNNTSIVALTLAQEKTVASSNGVGVRVREKYSQIRLTGHDFLSIGTGNTVTTNYPGTPSQSAVPSQEVVEARPGRVYYVSTDQNGNFKVGPYFKVEQATGKATLDASAFNLSGLSELRLGSIGAQLGESINEFSSDVTLSANAINKVPVQAAVKTYVDGRTTGFATANDILTQVFYSSNGITYDANGYITYYEDNSIVFSNTTYTINTTAYVLTSWKEKYKASNTTYTYTASYYANGTINSITRT